MLSIDASYIIYCILSCDDLLSAIRMVHCLTCQNAATRHGYNRFPAGDAVCNAGGIPSRPICSRRGRSHRRSRQDVPGGVLICSSKG